MASFGARTTITQRRKVIASWTAMAVVSTALTAYAISQRGYPVHHAALNDGGIWVTNPQQVDGGIGRENRPIEQLDAVVPACVQGCASLDVLQEGAAVFEVNDGAITPVDVASAAADPADSVTIGSSRAALGGGTLATLDANGNLRATAVDPNGGQNSAPAGLAPTTHPLAKVGAGGLLSVGINGVVYAAQGGTLTRLFPAGNGFQTPTSSSLSPAAATGGLGATVVGSTFVYPVGPTQIGVNGHTVTVPSGSVLQQPGNGSDTVLVGTPTGVTGVDLGSGSSTRVMTAAGTPSQPVRIGSCVYEAWSSSTSLVGVACGGGQPQFGTLVGARPSSCGTGASGSPLVLRVNRGQVVINDVCTGDVWPVGTGQIHTIADWQSLRPTKSDTSRSNQTISQQQRPKPHAVPDTLGVRAGSETVLHVLDNDTATPGSLLAISNVDARTLAKDVHVIISPDRQTILASADPGASGTATFSYTIDDGTGPGGPGATASVTLNLKPAADGTHVAPQPRGRTPDVPTYNVAAGGAVDMPVADGWRDRTYGDAVTVASTSTAGAQITPEGMLSYTASPTAGAGLVTVDYKVTTGGATTDGQVKVNVATGQQTVAPSPQPDIASGVIVNGQPATITIHPLANDLPGADPTNPAARLTLVSASPAGGGAPTPLVDTNAGTVQITATQPGNFLYRYSAGFGSSATSSANIRVVVTGGSTATPVAVPDTATLYGTQPKTVDVLANDFDPLGRILVLQSATPSTNGGGLEVGVVDNHWLRVAETDPTATGSAQVNYTISAGDGATATGTLTVQLAPANDNEDTPVTVDDHAVVRAGDTVTVPVLDNDTIPSGAPIGLLVSDHGFGGAACPKAPCGLPVESNDAGALGAATYAGSQIRYVAPAALTNPITVQIPYTAYNQSSPKHTATGTLFIQVIPKPASVADDRPPTPRPLEARMIQGDTIQIKLPGIGMDPDGDSVSLTGIGDPTSNDPAASVPQRGQVLSYTGNTITYQAFPTTSGTDTFSYVVTDTYGKSAAGTVRVGIAPSDAAQQPVPVNDAVRADPNRSLAINVTANDVHQPGTSLTLAPLADAPAGVTEDAGAGVIQVPAGLGRDGQVLDIPYALVGPVGETRSATLQITYRSGFDNPPLAGTIVATPKPGAATVTVNLASHVSDIDDATGLLIRGVTNPSGTTAPITNGAVTLPLAAAPVVWTYRVSDPAGAEAIGTIYVPATGAAGPYLKPGSVLHVNPNSSARMDLPAYVLDGAGKRVLLTTRDTFAAAPSGNLSIGSSTSTSLTVQAGSQVGVGSVSFEVTDGPSSTSSAGRHAMITLPVIIGDPQPVLNCPSAPITVFDEGASVPVNITQYCHVWTAEPGQANTLTYRTSKISPSGLSAQGGTGTVTVTAAGVMRDCHNQPSQVRGGSLTVSTGSSTSALQVGVHCLPSAVFTAPAPFATTTKAGPLTIDLTGSVSSPLAPSHRRIVVSSVTPTGGAPNTLSVHQGSAALTFTPTSQHGHFRYDVVLNDAGGASGRQISGQIEIDVAGAPGAPTNVQWDKAVPSDFLSRAVKLSWTPPRNDGDDPHGIDHYLVSVDGGAPNFTCPSSPCQVTGLSNKNTSYSFRVYAVNSVDKSVPSAPVTAFSGVLPGSVTNLRLAGVGDGRVTVTWSPPVCAQNGSCGSVTYQVSSNGAAPRSTGSATTATVTGANGQPLTIVISVQNALTQYLRSNGVGFDVGSPTALSPQPYPAGKPQAPSWVAPVETSSADMSTTKTVRLEWGAVAPNGPGNTTYQVSENTGGTSTVTCAWSTATSCVTTVPNDGQKHSYVVQARNDGALETTPNGNPGNYTSANSATTSVTGVGQPDASSIQSLVPTGQNGQSTATINVGASHGATSTLKCYVGSIGGTSCGSWPQSNLGAHQTTVTAQTPSNGTQALYFLDQNEGGGTGQSTSQGPSDSRAVDVYGPIGQVNFTSATYASGRTITFEIYIEPNGKPVHWSVDDGSGGHTWTGMTGENAFSTSNSWTESGYSTTYTLTLHVTDTSNSGPTRPSRTATSRQTTGPAPNPTVTVQKGSACGPATGTPCPSPTIPCQVTCWAVVVVTHNFSGNVACNLWDDTKSPPQADFGPAWTQGPNETKQNPDGAWVGPNEPFHASCSGVNSPITTW